MSPNLSARDVTLGGLQISASMKEHYEVKVRRCIGPDNGDDKEIRILDRCLKFGDKGIVQTMLRSLYDNSTYMTKLQ